MWLLFGVIFSLLFFLCDGPRVVGKLLWNQYMRDMYHAFLPRFYCTEDGEKLYEKTEDKIQTQVQRHTLDIARYTLLDETKEESLQSTFEEVEEALPLPEALHYFVPSDKVLSLRESAYQDLESLVKEFYTVDSTTGVDQELLNVNYLTSMDLSIEKETDGPQILIYHTHSLEGYRDSVEGDASTGVVGVGERLATILQEEYGYLVYHLEEAFDEPDFTKAYSNALPVITKLLEQYPSIQVIIDLHRDDLPKNYENTKVIQGMACARFMFFNGLSRTKKNGLLTNLPNENLGANLAFSFQLERKAKEYYPGLSRKIYLKGYRYNMHVAARTILLELGCQHNTFEEAVNSCYPIAHILDMVLRGEE